MLSVEIVTKNAEYILRLYQCKTNCHYFQHVDMELRLVFRRATMKGYWKRDTARRRKCAAITFTNFVKTHELGTFRMVRP